MRKLRPNGRPICGDPNERGTATGKTECWCAAVKILGEMPVRVAEGVKGQSVRVCQRWGDGPTLHQIEASGNWISRQA